MRTQMVDCCVVGGGPAGMMCGALLARQGIEVVVLEKHADFLRDFRGDTVHPSTLQMLDQLGWAQDFLTLPHTQMTDVTMSMGDTRITFADFGKLKVKYPFIAFVPQWDFLDFIAERAEKLPTFQLLRSSPVTELIIENGHVVGIVADGPDEPLEIRARLIVGADGRGSTVRIQAGLQPVQKSAPVDVLWFRLPRQPDDQVPFFQGGRGALISINRGDYWQLAYAIPTNAFDQLHEAGLTELYARVAALAPGLGDRIATNLRSWDEVHLLTVRIDRLKRWYRPGLLCIGDAAHAMSPAGGVGINLAIQDAVAAANVLGPVLASGEPSERDLRRVQRRRTPPTVITQKMQTGILRNLYPRNLTDDTTTHIPPIYRAFRALPALRYLAARVIGLGIRPEKIADPVQ